MIINNSYYMIEINDNNGSINSLKSMDKEFIAEGADERPVFSLRFRDEKGMSIDVDAGGVADFSIKTEKKNNSTVVKS